MAMAKAAVQARFAGLRRWLEIAAANPSEVIKKRDHLALLTIVSD